MVTFGFTNRNINYLFPHNTLFKFHLTRAVIKDGTDFVSLLHCYKFLLKCLSTTITEMNFYYTVDQ